MGLNKTENENFKVELLEYGFLTKDTDPCAEVFNVYVPKLQGLTTGGSNTTTESTDTSKIANDTNSGGSASTSQSHGTDIKVSPEIMIAHRHKFHDCPGNCVNLTHDAITCHPGTSHLKVCHHFHHDHHWPHVGEKGMIPANTRVIVLFMNHDPNNGLVTRLIADFPNGGYPAPPDEHR